MPQKTKSTGARHKKSPPVPLPIDRRRFRQRLLTWYRRHGRDLPWRKTDDPYHILVSEIMLQQTQVDRVLAKYAGALPSDQETLLSFKGIGEYTAGAIRSFAFRERAAILDTNVARVLLRIFVGNGDPKSHAMKKHLWTISETLVPTREVFDFNQALMDLGAMVCVARNPRCLVCPMAKSCRAVPFNPAHEARA